jgi:LPS sulfotransferase NodH
VTPIRRSYLICSTPRSGSNFLCEVLSSIGTAGRPDDYFWNPPYWHELWSVSDFPSYFQRLLAEGTTPNGVFGTKMMWDYLGELVPRLAEIANVNPAAPAAVLASAFPNIRYVWLTRRDKVRQAISYYRALETKVWRSTDAELSSAIDPPFNVEAIDRLVQLSIWEDEGWQEYFRTNRFEPLVVAYEDLAHDVEAEVNRILSWLGLPEARLADRTWRHQRQADAVTEQWAEQFRTSNHVDGKVRLTSPG